MVKRLQRIIDNGTQFDSQHVYILDIDQLFFEPDNRWLKIRFALVKYPDGL